MDTVKIGDKILMQFQGSGAMPAIVHEESLTIKSVDQYNEDFCVVSFEEKQGSYTFNVINMYLMKKAYEDRTQKV